MLLTADTTIYDSKMNNQLNGGNDERWWINTKAKDRHFLTNEIKIASHHF